MSSLLLGIVAIGALLTYFSFQIEEEHFILRFLLVIMVFILTIIGGQSTLEPECDWVINLTEEAYIYGDNYSDYHYEDYLADPSPSLNDLNLFHRNRTFHYTELCSDYESGAANNFFKWTLWVLRLFITYIIIFMGYQALEKLKDWWQRKQT